MGWEVAVRMHVAGNADSSTPSLIKYVSLGPLSNLLNLPLTIFKHDQSETSCLRFLPWKKRGKREGKTLPKGAFMGLMAAETKGPVLIESQTV